MSDGIIKLCASLDGYYHYNKRTKIRANSLIYKLLAKFKQTPCPFFTQPSTTNSTPNKNKNQEDDYNFLRKAKTHWLMPWATLAGTKDHDPGLQCPISILDYSAPYLIYVTLLYNPN